MIYGKKACRPGAWVFASRFFGGLRNSCCLWQTVERIVDTDKSAFLEHAHLSVEKRICSRECPRQHYFLSLTFNFQPENEKLLQESGHTRIVL